MPDAQTTQTTTATPSAAPAAPTTPASVPGEQAAPALGGYADPATRMEAMRDALHAFQATPAPSPDATPVEEPTLPVPAPDNAVADAPSPAPDLAALRQDIQRIRDENAELRQLLQELRAPVTPAEPAPPPTTPRPDPWDIDGQFVLLAGQHLGEHAGEHLTGRYADALKVVSDWRGFDRDGIDPKTRKQAQHHLAQAKAEMARIQDAASERARLAQIERRQEELEKRPDQARREQLVADARKAALEFLKAEDSPYPNLRRALGNGLDPEKLLAPVAFDTLHDDERWTDDQNNPLDVHLRVIEEALSALPTATAPREAQAATPAPALLHNPAALAIPAGGTTPSQREPGYTPQEERLAAMRAAAARLARS